MSPIECYFVLLKEKSTVYFFAKQRFNQGLIPLVASHNPHTGAPPTGFEPVHQPPEGCALSPELRGLGLRNHTRVDLREFARD